MPHVVKIHPAARCVRYLSIPHTRSPMVIHTQQNARARANSYYRSPLGTPRARTLAFALTTVKLHRKAHTEASDVCNPMACVK